MTSPAQVGTAELGARTLPALAKFRGRDFVTDQDYTREELLELVHLAVVLKELCTARSTVTPFLPGRHLGMIFDDPSTRTRISFETGMVGTGRPRRVPAARRDAPAGPRERGRHRSRALAIPARDQARTQTVAVLRELAERRDRPRHQRRGRRLGSPDPVAVSDTLTILEYGGRLEGETMAWLGHGDCMCNSVVLTFSRLGMNVNVATPPHFPLS